MKLKKLVLMLIIISSFVFLAGCNGDQNEQEDKPKEIVPLDVTITISPEKIEPGTEATIQAGVLYGDEKVEDANEVKFEVWEKGLEDQSEFIKGTHEGEGVYTAKKTFEHDGIYYVVAHVTARSMHNMPREEIVVGNVEDSDANGQKETDTTHEHGDNHTNHHDEDSHHDHEGLEINFETSAEVKVNEGTVLSATIKQEGSPLTEARVRFEIWRDGIEKHQYIDANEDKLGTYETEYTFGEEAVYQIRVHVEKEKLHDHVDKTVQVIE